MRTASNLKVPFVAAIIALLTMLPPKTSTAGADVYFAGQRVEHDDVLGDLEDGSGILPPRLALVIGIDNYDATYTSADNSEKKGVLLVHSPLDKAASDATAFADAIAKAGFDPVRLIAAKGSGKRVTRNDILHALGELETDALRAYEQTKRPPILLLYFAGHGLFFDDGSGSGSSTNFIIGSDFVPIVPEDDISNMAIKVDDILRRLQAKTTGLVIAIFDACRSTVVQGIGKKEISFGHTDVHLHYDTQRLYLIQSTLQLDQAPDDGQFNLALVSAFNAMLDKAKNRNSGSQLDLDTFKKFWMEQLNYQKGLKAEPDTTDRAYAFDFFSTKDDYGTELKNLKDAKISYDTSTNQSGSAANIYFWCSLQNITLNYTRYSYFRPEIERIMPNVGKFTLDRCVNPPDLNSNIGSPKFSPHSDSEKPVLLDAISDDTYRAALTNLDLTQPINSLAMSILPNPVYSTASADDKPVCNLVTYGLIQVLDASEGDGRVHVRTTTPNCVGYVDKSAVNTGRSIVSFDIPISTAKSNQKRAFEILKYLPSWLVTDANIYFDDSGADTPALALAQANSLRLQILSQINGVSPEVAGTIGILVQRVNRDDAIKYHVAPGTMKAVLSVIPVSEKARLTLPTRDYLPLNPASAVRLETALAGPPEFVPSSTVSSLSQDAPSKSPTAPRANKRVPEPLDRHDVAISNEPGLPNLPPIIEGDATNGEPAPIVPKLGGEPHPAEACLESANEQIKRAGDSVGQFRGEHASIVLSSDSPEMVRAYNAIASALRKAGFLSPKKKIVSSAKAPTGTGEVRYCAEGQNEQSARFALSILEGCALGQFDPVLTGEKTCNRVKDNDRENIEVWLAK